MSKSEEVIDLCPRMRSSAAETQEKYGIKGKQGRGCSGGGRGRGVVKGSATSSGSHDSHGTPETWW